MAQSAVAFSKLHVRNGWIEFEDSGILASRSGNRFFSTKKYLVLSVFIVLVKLCITARWGAGSWYVPSSSEDFLVVSFNAVSHLLLLRKASFEVVTKKPVGCDDWEQAMRDSVGDKELCEQFFEMVLVLVKRSSFFEFLAKNTRKSSKSVFSKLLTCAKEARARGVTPFRPVVGRAQVKKLCRGKRFEQMLRTLLRTSISLNY